MYKLKKFFFEDTLEGGIEAEYLVVTQDYGVCMENHTLEEIETGDFVANLSQYWQEVELVWEFSHTIVREIPRLIVNPVGNQSGFLGGVYNEEKYEKVKETSSVFRNQFGDELEERWLPKSQKMLTISVQELGEIAYAILKEKKLA